MPQGIFRPGEPSPGAVLGVDEVATSTMPPTVLSSNTIAIADPTGGAAPWSVATITTSTIQNSLGTFNAENVTFFLRGANASGLNGAISSDFVVGTDNHTLIPTDSIFYQPPGGDIVATYYGNELANPALAPYAASAGSPGFSPANPGYAYTQYTYANTGALVQVVAAQANGQIYIGTGIAAI